LYKRPTVTLAHSLVTAEDATPSRWVVILHGILGNRANWRSFARRLVMARPEWGAVLVDLRLHGQSLAFSPPHTLEAAAHDLFEFCADRRVEAVLGHSFGGKVALRWLADTPCAVSRAWIVDSMPGQRDTHHRSGSATQVIAMLESLPTRFDDRAAFVEATLARLRELRPGTRTEDDETLARWLAMSLERADDGSYALMFDLDAIRDLLDDYFAVDLWPLVESPPDGVDLHIVIGGRSAVYGSQELDRARAAATHPRVFVHEIADAGHWVHIDAPDALLDVVRGAL
jgi:pimeloyl-ACP methyl ester carboxylesterase